MTADYPTDPDLDEHDLGALLADRQALAEVTEQLVEARIALGVVARAVTDRSRERIRDGAHWVRLPRHALRAVDHALERINR